MLIFDLNTQYSIHEGPVLDTDIPIDCQISTRSAVLTVESSFNDGLPSHTHDVGGFCPGSLITAQATEIAKSDLHAELLRNFCLLKISRQVDEEAKTVEL